MAFKGEWEIEKAHFQKSIKYNEETKFVILSAYSWSGLEYTCSMLEDSEAGKSHAEKGLAIYGESGVEVGLSWCYYSLGWIFQDLDDLKHAQSNTEEALRLSQKNGEKFLEGISWILLGRVLGRKKPHRMDRAEENILKGMQILQGLKIKAYYSQGYFFLGELYLNAGKLEMARNNLKQAEGMFKEMGMGYWSARTNELMAKF